MKHVCFERELNGEEEVRKQSPMRPTNTGVGIRIYDLARRIAFGLEQPPLGTADTSGGNPDVGTQSSTNDFWRLAIYDDKA